MSRTALAAALSCALAVAGCVTAPISNTPVPVLTPTLIDTIASFLPANVQTKIDAVRAETTKVCHFVPTGTTVADILSGGNAIVGSIGDIAKAICGAVTSSKTVSRSGKTVAHGVVAGVPVTGEFVR